MDDPYLQLFSLHSLAGMFDLSISQLWHPVDHTLNLVNSGSFMCGFKLSLLNRYDAVVPLVDCMIVIVIGSFARSSMIQPFTIQLALSLEMPIWRQRQLFRKWPWMALRIFATSYASQVLFMIQELFFLILYFLCFFFLFSSLLYG